MPRAAVPCWDRRGLSPHDVARALLDQERHGQWPQRAHPLEGLQFVELQDRASWQLLLQVEVQAAQMARDLAELELQAAAAEAEQARALAQTDARREQLEEFGVEVGAMVVAVHPEGLAREAAPTTSADEAWDRVRSAQRLIGAVLGEPGLPYGRRNVVGAMPVGAPRGNEHRANLLFRGPCAGPAGAETPGKRDGCTRKPAKRAGRRTRMPDRAVRARTRRPARPKAQPPSRRGDWDRGTKPDSSAGDRPARASPGCRPPRSPRGRSRTPARA